MTDLGDRLQTDMHYQESMHSCMNCGICTAICPAAEFYRYDPRIIVDTVQRKNGEELEELLRSDTIWYCGECMSCRTRCPRCNTPGGIIMSLRRLSQEKGFFTASEKGRQQFALTRILGKNILQYGYCVTPDTVRPEMHPEQGPVWEWIYKNRHEVYRRTHASYRQEGAGTLRKMDRQSLDELRKIFEITGGMAFLEHIESSSMEKAEEMGMDQETYFHYTSTADDGSHTGT